MGYQAPEQDLDRAKGLKKQAQGIADPLARKAFTDAAARLERRAGAKVRKLGRRGKPGGGRSIVGDKVQRVVDIG